jgi:cobalt-zinc-cadmium efflux system outer membrane protein
MRGLGSRSSALSGCPAALAVGILIAVTYTSTQPALGQDGKEVLGATVDGLLAVSRQLSPSLRAAALDTAAAAAKADGADALDDPMLTDNYQYYRNPNVFSGHGVMVTQSFPLWGKRSLRRQAALADTAAARGREQSAQDESDERIKVAFAQYYAISRQIAVTQQIIGVARRMKAAATARYGQGGGNQVDLIQALGEETTAKIETSRLEGERGAARARINVLIARSPDAPLAEPTRLPARASAEPALGTLLDRARAGNPALSAGGAEIDAARTRRTLADKAWYPDLTIGAGPLILTNNRSVGVAATIGVNIPMPWGREASQQREAAAQLGATQQRYEAAWLNIQGALAEAVARLQAARSTEALLRREALPQARATIQSLLAGYSQGKGDLAAPIAAEHRAHDVELLLLKSELDQQVELAAIERLIGGPL